jgi:hypothetical protein
VLGSSNESAFEPLGHVADLVKKWNPRRCRTEKEYERSLVRHPQARLRGKEIDPQYGSGRTRGDIVVDDKVLIEVKVNLDSTGMSNILVGLLEGYERDWKKPVTVVLCGKHDRNLVNQLEGSMVRRGGGNTSGLFV